MWSRIKINSKSAIKIVKADKTTLSNGVQCILHVSLAVLGGSKFLGFGFDLILNCAIC